MIKRREFIAGLGSAGQWWCERSNPTEYGALAS
jgi:hypothetical protein